MLKPGDSVIVKPDLFHSSFSYQDTEYLVFHFEVEMKEIHSVFQLAKEPVIRCEEQDAIAHWVSDFIAFFSIHPQKKNPDLVQEDYLKNMHSAVNTLRLHSKVIELISILAEHFLSHGRLNETEVAPSQMKAAHEAAHWLEQHVTSIVKIADLAKVLNFHRSYLSQCFKKTYGMSPSDYLIRIRIREARQLLLETDLSIESISQHLSFSSTGHFSRTFRTIMNTSPLQFRKNKKVHYQIN